VLKVPGDVKVCTVYVLYDVIVPPVGAGVTVIENCLSAVSAPPSPVADALTVNVEVVELPTFVGLPDIAPVALFKEVPPGNAPATTA
jgi:hypothetical protein